MFELYIVSINTPHFWKTQSTIILESSNDFQRKDAFKTDVCETGKENDTYWCEKKHHIILLPIIFKSEMCLKTWEMKILISS